MPIQVEPMMKTKLLPMTVLIATLIGCSNNAAPPSIEPQPAASNDVQATTPAQPETPVAQSPDTTDSIKACIAPMKVGPCKARIKRYFYNLQARQCQLFRWGGCKPNENNFPTLEDCQAECESKTSSIK